MESRPKSGIKYLTIDDLRPKLLPKVCAALYIMCIMAAAFGDYKRLSIGTYFKVFTLGAAGLAMLTLFITSDLSNLKLLGKLTLIFVIPLAFVYIISLMIWAFGAYDKTYITRGSEKMIFQAVTMFVVVSSGYMFGSKSADYTLYGMAAGNGMIVAMEAKNSGIGNAIKSVINMLLTGDNSTGFAVNIEIHDITFAMGLFALYYIYRIFTIKFTIPDVIRGIIAGIFFILGFKRIAVLGMLMAIALMFLLKVLPNYIGSKLNLTICIAMTLCCYAYIYVISEGIFQQVMDYFGIETMGRNNIYRFIGDYYEFSPTYRGKGFEYTVAMLREMKSVGEGIGVTGIHNDMLKQYIEMGFWGFTAWIVYTFIYTIRWFGKNFGERVSNLALLFNVYVLLTYLTDNTIYYFWLSMSIKIILLSFAFEAHNDNNAEIRNQKRPKLNEEIVAELRKE